MTTLAFSFLIVCFFILAFNTDNHKISDGFKFRKIGPWTKELAAPERLKKFP